MLPLPTSPLLDKTRQLARAVQPLGGRALLVGGFVRDALLGLAPKDADIEVYGLPAEQLRAVLKTLGRVDAVGESFRVLKLVWHARNASGKRERFELDVSLPRRDRKTGTGHKGFEVEGDPFASIEDAARRRDFTLNAILCDPLTGDIVDPFNGRRDLEARLLRAVDERHFGEDSLRVLRAVQFAARFDLTIDPATAALCRATPLDDLPRERVWGEWEKWLLRAARPSIGLRAGRETGVFARLFPSLERALEREGERMNSQPARSSAFADGVTAPASAKADDLAGCEFIRSTIPAALDRAAIEARALDFPESIALTLATLGSFLGWRDTKRLLDDLGIHRLKGRGDAVDVRALVIKLVGARKVAPDWFRRAPVEAKEFRFFAARVPPQLALKLARARGFDEAASWFETGLRAAGVEFGPPAPLLQGRHLLEMGWKPGPVFGKVCERVYFLQLSGEVATLEDAKAAARTCRDDMGTASN